MALHAGDTITCAVCNRKFDSTESLTMHAAVHSDVHNTPGPELFDNQELQQQKKLELEGSIEPFMVTANNEGSVTYVKSKSDTQYSKDTDQLNAQDELQNLKPYQCQHCGRRFMRPHEKVKHERIHTGEKPHSCEVSLIQNDSLLTLSLN